MHPLAACYVCSAAPLQTERSCTGLAACLPAALLPYDVQARSALVPHSNKHASTQSLAMTCRYAGDFGGKPGTLKFLHEHTKGDLQKEVERLQGLPEDQLDFQWQDYDWSSNAA